MYYKFSSNNHYIRPTNNHLTFLQKKKLLHCVDGRVHECHTYVLKGYKGVRQYDGTTEYK